MPDEITSMTLLQEIEMLKNRSSDQHWQSCEKSAINGANTCKDPRTKRERDCRIKNPITLFN